MLGSLTCELGFPSSSKRRASFLGGLPPPWLRFCMAARAGADPDDVDVISGVSEPHGPYGAMADRGSPGAEISQPRPAGPIRQIVRTDRPRTRADFSRTPYLHP